MQCKELERLKGVSPVFFVLAFSTGDVQRFLKIFSYCNRFFFRHDGQVIFGMPSSTEVAESIYYVQTEFGSKLSTYKPHKYLSCDFQPYTISPKYTLVDVSFRIMSRLFHIKKP